MTSGRSPAPLPSYWQRKHDEERHKLEDAREEVKALTRLLRRAEEERDRYKRAFWWVAGGCVVAFLLSAVLWLGRV